MVKAAGLKTTTNQAVGAWFSNFLEEKTKKKRKMSARERGERELQVAKKNNGRFESKD